MTLPDEFVTLFNFVVTELKKETKTDEFRSIIQYDYTHERDFVYGHKTGEFLGFLFGWWEARYGGDPNQEQMKEIIDMYREHLDEVKQSFSKLKN